MRQGPCSLLRQRHRDRADRKWSRHRRDQKERLRRRWRPVAPGGDSHTSRQLLCDARLAHGARRALRQIPAVLLVRRKQLETGAQSDDDDAAVDAETARRLRSV